MTVDNLSSSNFTFQALWPDGTSQDVTLHSGTVFHCYGFVGDGQSNMDGFDTQYEVVVDDNSGVQVHADLSPTGVVVQGFADGLGLVAVMVAVWMIVKGLRPSLPRD